MVFKLVTNIIWAKIILRHSNKTVTIGNPIGHQDIGLGLKPKVTNNNLLGHNFKSWALVTQ